MGFTLADSISCQNLEQALNDNKVSVGTVCRLSNSRVCVVSSLEPQIMRKLVSATYGEAEKPEFATKALGYAEALDSKDIIDALTSTDPQVEPATPATNGASSMPFILEKAIDEAIDQMAPYAQAIRLRTIIRVLREAPRKD